MKSFNRTLLIIDDEANHRMMIQAILEEEKWFITEANSAEAALDIIKKNYPDLPDVILVDMRMGGMSGLDFLYVLKETYEEYIPVILLTAYANIDSAVATMKQGAFDYLTKPTDNDSLILSLNKAYEFKSLKDENRKLKQEINTNTPCKLVGTSAGIQQIQSYVEQVAPSDATVLIFGESGTGKELVAEGIHSASNRSKNAFIKVNCAALPADLLESELFGYEKGAFTGAIKKKPGRFQLANKGTLFLDEIGEIQMSLQAKLLRALQEHVIEPLGGISPIPVDIRIIAATNKDLKLAVAEGTFREDLYYRLNVLKIIIPPLREHLEDLALLVNHLTIKIAKRNNRNITTIENSFIDYLAQHSWPGNVRELENVLERAIIFAQNGVLSKKLLEEQKFFPKIGTEKIKTSQENVYQNTSENSNSNRANNTIIVNGENNAENNSLLASTEKDLLLETLRVNLGHREKTAQTLGICRRTLQYKLKKYGLTRYHLQ